MMIVFRADMEKGLLLVYSYTGHSTHTLFKFVKAAQLSPLSQEFLHGLNLPLMNGLLEDFPVRVYLLRDYRFFGQNQLLLLLL